MAGIQTRIEQLRIAPSIHHMDVRIEFDHRRREFAGIQLTRKNVLTVEDQNVVLGIDAHATKAAQHPLIGKRLWPGQIGDVFRRGALRLRGGCENTETGHGGQKNGCEWLAASFHLSPPGYGVAFHACSCPAKLARISGRAVWRPKKGTVSV